MGLINVPNTFSAGATILASEHNENFSTVYNLVNGNIDNANIKASAGIVDTKLAQITTASKVATSAVADDDITLKEITCDASIYDEGSAITTGAGQGAVYTKDTSGQPELFYREESDGDEVQITTGGKLKDMRVAKEIVRAWAKFDGNTGAVDDSYNVTSVVRNSEGNYTVTWDTDFADADYAVSINNKYSSTPIVHAITAQAAGTLTFGSGILPNGAAQDPDSVYIIAVGEQ